MSPVQSDCQTCAQGEELVYEYERDTVHGRQRLRHRFGIQCDCAQCVESQALPLENSTGEDGGSTTPAAGSVPFVFSQKEASKNE